MIERGVNYADLFVKKVKRNKKKYPKTVLKAVERYERWKKRKDIWLDLDAANKAMDFMETFCIYAEGEVAGQHYELKDWQRFAFTNIYGWKKKDDNGQDVRVIRTSYIQVPRKNEKTTIAAGAATYALYADGEFGAECYTAAVDKEQANISAKKIAITIENSPDLNQRTQIYKGPKGGVNAIVYSFTVNGKKFKNTLQPLSRETKGLDGKNPHFVLLDEVHAQGNADMYDVLKSGMGARRQPLMMIVSTAGKGTTSVGLQIYDYCKKILNGEIDDDSWFVLIYEPDKGDRWDDPTVWAKVNPNYGISVKKDYLMNQFKEAQVSAERKDEFLAKHLNIFVRSSGTYFERDIVERCLVNDLGDLTGMTCVVGLDLSKTTDLTCVSLNFPVVDESGKAKLKVKQMYFIPSEGLEAREKMENIPYRHLVERGFVTLCEGKTIDYDMVFEYIKEQSQMYDIKQINYDPAHAVKLVEKLEMEGFDCVEVRQYPSTLNAPFDDLEILMYEGRVETDNPLLIYCTENVVAFINTQGLKVPSKKQSQYKIDGFVAMLTAHKETMNMMIDVSEEEYMAMIEVLYKR
ncbi:terminase large subunit [Anoxybacillus sp. J5B_2022]|uniref:terminase large subunit n=1 Tax=Anoxybacillus sp. J5B_2022 TaxID=3003246 RepID=UPI002286368B|nr:terminase TerL endonuclease subunit [Anoxybacillus sp. J5B_2022]MCZ0754318.1 terminase large subunit [Anoxybacillus sp. J5B_2022]